MRLHSKYIDRRDYNLLLICASILSVVTIHFVLRDLAVKANEIISPLQDGYVLTHEKDVPVITYTIPDLVQDQIKMVFGKDADDAIKVAKCESGLNPKARNKESTATGVFQIMASVHGVSRKRLENSMVNIVIAKELFDNSGWTPWVSSIKCHGVK